MFGKRFLKFKIKFLELKKKNLHILQHPNKVLVTSATQVALFRLVLRTS